MNKFERIFGKNVKLDDGFKMKPFNQPSGQNKFAEYKKNWMAGPKIASQISKPLVPDKLPIPEPPKTVKDDDSEINVSRDPTPLKNPSIFPNFEDLKPNIESQIKPKKTRAKRTEKVNKIKDESKAIKKEKRVKNPFKELK